VLIFGVLIVFDLDRLLEAKLTNVIPDAWLGLVTRY
jgi:hypothetical protein